MRALFIGLVALGSSLCPAQSDLEKAKAARSILESYHLEKPVPGERKLHIVCWRPADRDFPADQRDRIPRIMEHIRRFYESEMDRHGFGKLTFNLDRDKEGTLVIHEAIGKDNYQNYGRPDGNRIRKECIPVLEEAGIDASRETILIFTNLSEWDPDKNTFFHKSPYYARGSFRGGTAWQLDSPELDTRNLTLKKPIIQDGEYGKISLGKHNSIFIGGVAHEVGHAFGLPHCRQSDEEKKLLGTALMGSGNRTYFDQVRGEGKGSFLTLASALRLASHPQFTGSIKGMNQPIKPRFTNLSCEAKSSFFTITGKVDCPLPSYAVLAYLDPEGRGDYDSRTVVTIPDGDGNFTIECDALVKGKVGEIRLFALVVNGATTRWSGRYRVEKNGTVNTDAITIPLQLSDFLTSVRNRDFKGAQAIRDGLEKDSRVREIADSILGGLIQNRKTLAANAIPASEKSFPLSRITPAEAKVGWQRPAYDHVPGPALVLTCGAEVFSTGIYAHAPGRHRYDLTGGSWKTLVGKCGVPPGRRKGSVEFVIKKDGKEVYRSPQTVPGQSHHYKIDLENAGSLELITEDAGDGNDSDWGMWFEPILSR